VPLSPEEHSAMFPLLEDLERCPPGSRHSGYVVQALFGYLVVLLSRVEAASHQGLTVERPLPPLVLKVLDYLYSHYQESQSLDKKSTRLNSSHGSDSYVVFCLKKKDIT